MFQLYTSELITNSGAIGDRCIVKGCPRCRNILLKQSKEKNSIKRRGKARIELFLLFSFWLLRGANFKKNKSKWEKQV